MPAEAVRNDKTEERMVRTNVLEASGQASDHILGSALAEASLLFVHDNTPSSNLRWFKEPFVNPTQGNQYK
jgi:hypothetical protein